MREHHHNTQKSTKHHKTIKQITQQIMIRDMMGQKET